MEHKGLRFNTGKIRYDLVPTSAVEGIARVLSYGADKYTVKDEEGNIIVKGDDNWRLGMPWKTVYASLSRHLAAWYRGEDRDYDPNCGSCREGYCKSHSGELHIDHILTNAAFLKEYITIYPEGDDRRVWFKNPLKQLWLDLDGVIVDFETHFLKYLGLPEYHPTDWNDYRFRDNFNKISNDTEFWESCPPLISPEEIDYPIAGYCTARPCSNEVIANWLKINKFPKAELINVGSGGSKVDTLKSKGNIVMVDDSITNFVEMQSNGIVCYLMTRPHNIKYNVGMYRCNTIKDLLDKIKNPQ